MKEIIYLSSNELSREVRDKANEMGISLIGIPRCEYLPEPTSHHPDMLFYRLSDGALITDRRYYDHNRKFFERIAQYREIKTSIADISKVYPADIRYDILNIDGVIYGRTDMACPEAVQEARRIVQVKQGYARCSVLYAGDCAVTADEGLCKALNEDGIDVLKITPGNIELEGYGTGFIGGASAYIKELDTVLFFGDLSAHPDGDNIFEFLSSRGHKVKFVPEVKLSDYGGFVGLSL